MKTKYGFLIVNASNVFKVVADLGIKKWPPIKPSMDLKDYVAGDLTLEQREEVERFAPKGEVVFLENPKGKIFRGFRSVAKNWVTVFSLLEDDLVVLTAEFKHGAEVICLVPPSGVPGRKDFGFEDPMMECARREFWEETGIELEELILLSSSEGNAVSPRQTTQRYFPYLGIPKMPISQTKQKLDRNEFLQVLLIPLKEWLDLIRENKVVDECAITCTFRALQHLGRLEIK